MSIEVGQKYKTHFGRTAEIKYVGKEYAFILRSDGIEDVYSTVAIEDRWELIEPWFEVGKSYRWSSGSTYEVEQLLEREGERFALAWFSTDHGMKGYAILEEDDYDASREVRA